MSDEAEVLDTQDDAVATPEAPSMDDTIRATLAEIESRGEEPAETVEQAEQRARDEKGRFAPKEAAPEEPASPVEAVAQEPAAPVEVPASVPPELQRLGLKKEEADAIAKNPVAMNAIIRRSEEMHKGLEQYREKAQIGAAFEQAISPYMATIQGLGVRPEVAVQKLMAADHSLRYGTPQQKQAMLAQISRDYGIEPMTQEQLASQPQADPEVAALRQQLQQTQAWIEQQNQAKEWQERNELNSSIEKFASNPSNAYFNDVRNEMAGLLQAGLAASLEDAYEKAIYANPAIRAKVIAEQQAKADEARKQEANQRAQAAKQAAQVNVPRKGRLAPAKPVGTMEDTIRETAEKLGLIA